MSEQERERWWPSVALVLMTIALVLMTILNSWSVIELVGKTKSQN